MDTQSAIGSVTKSFTAVVIAQLIEEGKLSLDDTIDTWFPDQPNGDKITVRMLLSHTSGLNKYINGPQHVDEMQAGKFAPEWAPLDLVAEANEADPVDEPGSSDAHYANTNFVLLGLITEAITGNSWAQEVEARIIQPLDLQNTTFLSAEGILDTMVGGYAKSEDGYQNLLEEPWYPHASSVWSAGEIVATAADLMTFAAALFDGELVSSETLAVMAQPVGTDADSGIMWGLGGGTIEGLPPGAFGMGGDIPGASAFYMGVLDTKLVAVALVNSQGGDAIAPSIAALEYLSSLQSGAQEPTVATEIQAPDYQKIIDEVLQDDRPGIALRVTTPEFEYFETRGYADWENKIPYEKDHLSRIASVTKTFIATLTLMLHVEGELDLDEPITSYLPESMTSHIQYADQITIRQLLNHTSGIFDTGDNPAWWAAQFENPTKEWTDAEALEFAYDQPAYFEPGTGFAYSNTNYQLTGLILDEVLGHHHSEELRSRILDPLGLSSTFYEQHEQFDRDRLTHGYFDFDGDGIAEDYYDLRIDTGHADGGLISTVEDMEVFITALFKNDDFPDAGTKEEFLQELMTFQPAASPDPAELGSGPGIVEYDYGYGKGYGHTGGTPGYVSNMIHFPEHDVTLTLTWNGMDGGFESMGTVSIMFDSLIEATFSALGHEKAVGENDAPTGNVYEDPQGRFSMPLVGEWTPVENTGAFAHFAQTEPSINMYVVTTDSDDLDAGIEMALTEIEIDPDALTLLEAVGLAKWNVLFYSLDAEQGVTMLAQVRDGATYSLIFTGDSGVMRSPPAEVPQMIEGFAFAGDEVALPATVEEFEAYANSLVEEMPPGLSIVIAANGAVAYTNGFGMADGPLDMAATPDTVYLWASMTKIATATAIMQLYEQGLLDLDAPVADYLDYFPAEYPITVRQLLDHSAGLSDPTGIAIRYLNLDGDPQSDPDEAARTYYAQFGGPAFEPGSTSAYANIHFLTLGEIVATISGQPYIEYVQEHILDPLGMMQTGFAYSEDMIANAAAGAIPASQTKNLVAGLDQTRGLGDGADFVRETGEQYTWMNRSNIFAPWGGLIGPATDVMRFAQMHLNGGKLDGVRVLSPESVALMQEMQLSTAGDALGHGLGWKISDDDERLSVQHSGSGPGVQALMRLYPNEGVAVVLMSNAVGYEEAELVDAAANVVFTMLGGGE